ncbi:MAG: glycosyltransferase family 4 protein [Candidatus Stygibacter australis]|nr:glycosyltransferase family 4 protein [Candidatus Stygibacter australis]
MPKVLIITYYWPPAGGPGVQRLLKFVKYLPEFGWEPIVLTVDIGNFPAYDHSLISEIPSDVKVYQTKNYEPDVIYRKFTGKKEDNIPVAVLAARKLNWKMRIAHWIRLNLFVPDAKIGWIASAVKTAGRIIREENIDLIYSSSPPPTTHLIAQKLKKKYNLKWIADFRDPWTKIHYYHKANRCFLAKYLDEYLERKVLQECDGVTTASSMFQKLLPIEDGKPRETITNGYDDEVINAKVEKGKNFVLLHAGGITSNRFYFEFFEGLQKFLADHEKRAKTQLVLVGKVNNEIVDEIRKYVPPEVLQISGYQPHNKALSMMGSASVNLIFLEKLANYQGHIPGKIFEYIAMQRPVLGAGDPEGDTAKIIRQSGCGNVFAAGSDWLEIINNAFENWMNNNEIKVDDKYIEQFHRRQLTNKLADFFGEVL